MFNWREIPLVRILLPFIVGIIIALEFNKAFPLFDYILLFLLLPVFLFVKTRFQFRYRWIYGLLISIFFLLLGYQLCFYHADLNRKNHFKTWVSSENIVIGKIDNSLSFNTKFIKVNLQTQQIGQPHGKLHGCQGTLLLSILNDAESRKLAYGDVLICKAKIKGVRPSLNPNSFNYREFLHLKNIDYQAFVVGREWDILSRNEGNPILNLAFNLRQKYLNTLKNHLSGKNEFAVGSALILGYKEELNESLKTAYANTGAMHVLAVSGLHVGLIWGFVAALLGWVPWRHATWKWVKTIITLTCLWLFALITGASPSVLRAATMFSFVIVGTSLGRSVNIYNTLAASAFCLLLINPFLIKEVGFQLSYFAVIGIVYFQPKVYRLWYIKNRGGNFFWKLTAVAIAAQITTFPLSLYYFHQFPLYFWLSGIVVVPFAFLILGGGVLLMLLDGIIPFIGKFVGMLLNGIIWLMNSLIFLIEQLPAGLLTGIWISLGTMLLLYAFLLFVSFSINTKRIAWLLRAMVFAVIICIFFAFRSIKNQTQKEIVFYHVKNKTYVEFVEGQEVVSFGDLDIDSKTLKFANGDYHLSKNIKSIVKFHFGYEDIHLNNWMQSNGFIQFYNKKIAFLKHLPPIQSHQKVLVDYVLIRKNPSFELSELLDQIEFKTIILDGATDKNVRGKWLRDCSESAIPFYDLNSKGALILKAN